MPSLPLHPYLASQRSPPGDHSADGRTKEEKDAHSRKQGGQSKGIRLGSASACHETCRRCLTFLRNTYLFKISCRQSRCPLTSAVAAWEPQSHRGRKGPRTSRRTLIPQTTAPLQSAQTHRLLSDSIGLPSVTWRCCLLGAS